MSFGGGSSEAATRASRAEQALDREDFTAARADLTWLASRCDSGKRRRRALMLIAASDLDPASPHFSPREAARAAGAYLHDADADAHELPVARALFRLAVDLVELQGGRAARDAIGSGAYDCAEAGASGARELPAQPSTSAVSSLRGATAGRSDSLTVLRVHADSLRSELDRITSLLREGTAPARAEPGGRR
jgi:hypothetical protein